MTGKMRVWLVKSAIRPNIVRWPAVIFSPVIVDWLFIAMIENVTHGLLPIWKFSIGGWKPDSIFTRRHKMAHELKLPLPIFHNIITYWVHPRKGTSMQPSKLKLLLGHHLATNSFGLGRLFYKSSRQLQNFRRHGDQNGPNLEGWYAKIEPKSKRKAKNRKSN